MDDFFQSSPMLDAVQQIRAIILDGVSEVSAISDAELLKRAQFARGDIAAVFQVALHKSPKPWPITVDELVNLAVSQLTVHPSQWDAAVERLPIVAHVSRDPSFLSVAAHRALRIDDRRADSLAFPERIDLGRWGKCYVQLRSVAGPDIIDDARAPVLTVHVEADGVEMTPLAAQVAADEIAETIEAIILTLLDVDHFGLRADQSGIRWSDDGTRGDLKDACQDWVNSISGMLALLIQTPPEREDHLHHVLSRSLRMLAIANRVKDETAATVLRWAVIESILRKQPESIKAVVSRRCVVLLGDKVRDRHGHIEAIKKLYDLRCEISHSGKSVNDSDSVEQSRLSSRLANGVFAAAFAWMTLRQTQAIDPLSENLRKDLDVFAESDQLMYEGPSRFAQCLPPPSASKSNGC